MSQIQDTGWIGGQHAMVRPLSLDLRELIPTAALLGESYRAVAARLGVAVSPVMKWSQHHRAIRSLTPSKMGGHRKRVWESHRAIIIERIGQVSHLTLHELRARRASVQK